MDLINLLTKPNDLNEELKTKAELYRSDPFSAKIRPEYILFVKQICNEDKRQLNPDECEEQRQVKKIKSTETSEQSDEKQIVKKSTKEVKICPLFGEGKKCGYGDSCKYSHNLKEWLGNKPKNIHDLCYLFEKYGYCSFGITCRFNNKHVIYRDDSFENVIDIERFPDLSNTLNLNKIYKIENALPFELKNKLWKKKYDFGKANRVHKIVSDYINSNGLANVKYNQNKGIVNKQSLSDNTTKSDNLNHIAEHQMQNDQVESENMTSEPVLNEKKTGFVSDEDLIKLRPAEKKTIEWKDKLYLAPLTTLGNLPFRRIAKEFGADITCSEMAMCTNLLNGNASEWALLKRHESETLFGVQLAGSHADSLCKASQIINENFHVDFIDINSGCPIDLVFNKGSGCALMTRLDHFQRIIRSLDNLLDIPVTAKIRTGIKEDNLIAHDIVPSLKSWGASMITVRLFLIC
jgi:tRNA-dihydrouridine synthase 3